MSDTRPRTPASRAAAPADPNYAARRMLVSAIAITAIVLMASVAWQMVRGDDAGRPVTDAAWDTIALVVTSSGDVTLVDPDGALVARHAGDGRVIGVHAAGSRLALVQSSAVTLLDVAAGTEAAPDRIELDPRARTVTRLPTERDRLLLAAGNRNGGEIRVVDGDTGEAYDIAEMAGLDGARLFTGTLRVDPAGTAIAVADATSFQTVAVRGLGQPPDAEPSVENFADQPLAVDARLVATTQVVGGRADLTLHSAATPSPASVSTGIPAGGLIVQGVLIAVTTDGSVIGLRPGDRQVRQLDALELPAGASVTSVHAALGGSRLIVYADAYVAVLDVDGTLIHSRTWTGPAEPLTPAWEWTCLPIGVGTADAAVISLDDGAELAVLDDIAVSGTSADGCTVLGTRDAQTVVVGARGRGLLGATRAAALSPDATVVVRRLADGTTELVPLDEALRPGTPVDISSAVPTPAVTVAFVDR